MMAKKPRVEVLERNLQTGLDVLASDPRYQARLEHPFNEPSMPIALKQPDRECRWFNSAIDHDHIWRAKRKGWDPVKATDVVDLDQIGGYNVSVDGCITRGERGQEVLMSMPRVIRVAVQAAKTRHNLAAVGNPNKTKADVVNAAGQQLGSEAAEYLHEHIGPVGEVTDMIERVERVDPD